ncbi:MAG: hypothetical protein OXC80_14560 [Gammaproteobacteria bacterium]|nr:hypothetical protein [Gammaproteobacteria bacterium]
MPRQSEEVINAKLGELLMERHPNWSEENVHIEKTGVIVGRPSDKPDVLLDTHGCQPVVVECKHKEGDVSGVEQQIRDRIGSVTTWGNLIEAGVAVVYPPEVTQGSLENSTLEFATLQISEDDTLQRFPKEGWSSGSINDLANTIELVTLSERLVSQGETVLVHGVQSLSHVLYREEYPVPLGLVLHQEDGEQTCRMAAAILINAFVFHYSIEKLPNVPRVDSALGERCNWLEIARKWKSILTINYYPIFSLALSLLEQIHTSLRNSVLTVANSTAVQLTDLGATTFHELTGKMFQTLITDRKLLATFYTLPSSATLLAELALDRMEVNWSQQASWLEMRIADFACGTGALLSAVQKGIYRRIRRAGGNDKKMHAHFMESVLVGADIMPSAAHITSSMLSSTFPGVAYKYSQIRTLPYGTDEATSRAREADVNEVYLGSLDLIRDEHAFGLFGSVEPSARLEIGGTRIAGDEKYLEEDSRLFPVTDGTFDLVIMNPPFTRPVGQEGDRIGVPVPSFAGFDNSEIEQKLMMKKLQSMQREFGHGKAGLASDFMDVAHRKLKEGGIMALILPFTFIAGGAWKKARNKLQADYEDISIVSIAEDSVRNFSSETAMAECLVIARRKDLSEERTATKVEFLNLPHRPYSLMEAMDYVKTVHTQAIKADLSQSGLAGMRDHELGEMVKNLTEGELVLPRVTPKYQIPIVRMGEVAERGVYHMRLMKSYGGVFEKLPLNPQDQPTYPMLWNHDANREKRMLVSPDSKGVVEPNERALANEVWENTTSRLHSNRDFRLNSQPLSVCITSEPSIGGRAWPNLIPNQEEFNEPLVLWGNSIFGLILFWWVATRQQKGRAMLSISAIPNMLTLDVRKLSPAQIDMCKSIFEEFKDREFLPANEAYRDEARKELDAALLSMLNLPSSLSDGLQLLRLKWCSEPSVHGGKSTRPPLSTRE